MKTMSHRVIALYNDRDKARLAQGDVLSVGIDASNVRLAEGLSEGSGRVEVRARNMDQAINVRSFLEQDGADSVEIVGGLDDVLAADRIPHVPA